LIIQSIKISIVNNEKSIAIKIIIKHILPFLIFQKMLSKSVQNRNHLARALKQQQGAASQNSRLIAVAKRAFSHGPYNPLAYKTMLVPEDMPS